MKVYNVHVHVHYKCCVIIILLSLSVSYYRPVLSKATIDWDKVLSLRPQMVSEMNNDTNENKSRFVA